MNEALHDHYAQLADTYDETWAHRPEYLDWMHDRIRRGLRARPGEWIADIGGGTGLFARRLLPYATERRPLLCVDPSAAMLARLPRDHRLRPVAATAEQIAAHGVPLPCDTFDAVLVKEAVHHFTALEETLTGLAGRLADRGRILVVTLPPKLGYPLFPRALDRFAAAQPEPARVAAALRGAGLAVTTGTEEFRVFVERDHWLHLVAHRWMSVLSTFSDAELRDGLREIAEQHPGPVLEFTDRFAFVLGVAGTT
ncbi:methyltransferase [Streptomyces sp. NPDC007100]|uniref:class I SAM-dependent DNA methyltransferase n=1 Tax=Streptomyces sp. NPDC007100 TaxID=3155602 RepID=UPI0033D2C392